VIRGVLAEAVEPKHLPSGGGLFAELRLEVGAQAFVVHLYGTHAEKVRDWQAGCGVRIEGDLANLHAHTQRDLEVERSVVIATAAEEICKPARPERD